MDSQSHSPPYIITCRNERPASISHTPLEIKMRYTARRRFYKRKNNNGWSPQQTVINVELAAGTNAYQTGTFDIVAPSTDEGCRTVAHLRMKLLTDFVNTTEDN